MGIGSSMRAAKWTLIVCELAPGVCKDGRCFLDPGETSAVPPNRLLSALISWLLITACVSSGWNYLSVSASPSHECVWWLWMGGWGAFYLDWGGCVCGSCSVCVALHITAFTTPLAPLGLDQRDGSTQSAEAREAQRKEDEICVCVCVFCSVLLWSPC